MALNLKDDEGILLGCSPLSLSPEPPPEQQDCKIVNCPKCKTPIWLSLKKRQIIQSYPPNAVVFLCLPCAARFNAQSPCPEVDITDLI